MDGWRWPNRAAHPWHGAQSTVRRIRQALTMASPVSGPPARLAFTSARVGFVTAIMTTTTIARRYFVWSVIRPTNFQPWSRIQTYV